MGSQNGKPEIEGREARAANITERGQGTWLSSPKYLRADIGLFVSVAKVRGILRMVSNCWCVELWLRGFWAQY